MFWNAPPPCFPNCLFTHGSAPLQAESLWGNVFVEVAERGLNQMLCNSTGRSAVLNLADSLASNGPKCVGLCGGAWPLIESSSSSTCPQSLPSSTFSSESPENLLKMNSRQNLH